MVNNGAIDILVYMKPIKLSLAYTVIDVECNPFNIMKFGKKKMEFLRFI